MSEYEKLQTLLHQDGSGPSYRILNTERPVGIEVFIHDPNLIQDRVTFLNRPDGLLDVSPKTAKRLVEEANQKETKIRRFKRIGMPTSDVVKAFGLEANRKQITTLRASMR